MVLPAAYNTNWSNWNWNAGYTNTKPADKEDDAAKKWNDAIKKSEEAQKKKEANRKAILEYNEKLRTLGDGLPDENGKINTEYSRKNVEKQYDDLKKAKIHEDGSVSGYNTDLKKMSFWKKVGRGAMNALTGIGNVCKSLVGFDKNGKWNPVKCAINVAIATAAVVLCCTGVCAPAGAALAASLGGGAVATALGTAVAAIPATLCAAGIATGGYMAVKGAVDTANAKTIEEFDNATQDIGAGTFIGVTSAFGLKNMGAEAGLTGISKFNPFAIGKAGMNTASDAMAAALANGAGKAAAFNAGRHAALKMGAASAENNFESSLSKAKDNLNSEINNLRTEMQTARTAGDTKAVSLLKIKMQSLEKNLKNLEDVKDYEGWRALPSSNEEYLANLDGYIQTLENSGKVKINGYTFKAGNKAELQSVMKEVAKKQAGITKELKTLRELRFESMNKLAKHRFYKDEVSDFGYDSSYGMHLKGKMSNSWKTFRGKYDTKKSLAGGLAWHGGNKAFLVADPFFLIQDTAGAANYGPRVLTCFTLPHEMNADFNYTAEEAQKLEQELLAIKNKYDEAEKAIKSEIKKLEEQNSSLA